MFALGNACRLALDLGLHQDWSYLPHARASTMDVEVRCVIFWGCFSFDRYPTWLVLLFHTATYTLTSLWGLYLGRPPIIKLTDVSIHRPNKHAASWDLKIFAAWVELLDIAGQISEKL